MNRRPKFAFPIFLLCLLVNGALIGSLYYGGSQVLGSLADWNRVLAHSGKTGLTPALADAMAQQSHLISQVHDYLLPILLGTGAVATLVLWLFLVLTVRRILGLAVREEGRVPGDEAKEGNDEHRGEEAGDTPIEGEEAGAVQIMALLQRKGRLVDFLREDLSAYDDAQIGAAVRSIHQGCRSVLEEHMELEPIFKEDEGSRVTIPQGFDASLIRLTGSVVGDPPFQGILRHRGWRLRRVHLPEKTGTSGDAWVIAQAEVEIEQ